MSATLQPPRAWQRMLSGRRLDLLDPAPQDVSIEDIAHGLARVARWNGQTRGPNPFSVAQHSVLVETVVGLLRPTLPPAERLAALLHDGPEYVIGDLISPFKVAMGDAYRAVEHRILDAILRRYDLPAITPDLAALIKRADLMAAYCEATQLAGFEADEAGRFFGDPGIAATLPPLVPLRAEEAERGLLARFGVLDAARSGASPALT